MPQYSTLTKAKKILAAYDDIQPRKYVVNAYSKQDPKEKLNRSYSSSKKHSHLKKDFSFSKSPHRHESSVLNSTSIDKRKQKQSSFVSHYGKQTRYDKIMKLKIKPSFNQSTKDKRRNSILEHSLSSSNRSFKHNNKENQCMNKLSRLDKIMSIKIAKPEISSTLIHYEPKMGSRSITKQKKESLVKEWKDSHNKIKKSKEIEEKQDRLWKVFERQRDIRFMLKKNAEEREYRQQRRKQKRFETMVSKEVAKIEKERDISKRKSQGFANYIYPFH